GCGRLPVDARAAGDERRRRREDVDDVRVPGVHLGLARGLAPARVHHVVPAGAVEEDGALGEGRGDLVGGKVRHVCSERRRGAREEQCEDRRWSAHSAVSLHSSAAAPALATSSSRCWLAAPLTPIAPTTLPSTSSGTPPWSGVKSSSAIMAVRPFLMMFSKAAVGFLKSAAVRALPIEMCAPAANVPSSRSRY